MSNIAVISLAGTQVLVKPGDTFEVNKLQEEPEKEFSPDVLLSTDGDKVLYNEGKVQAQVLTHKKDKKLYIIKFRAKSRYRRRTGHRQHISLVKIVAINGEKESKKSPKAETAAQSKDTKTSDSPVKDSKNSSTTTTTKKKSPAKEETKAKKTEVSEKKATKAKSEEKPSKSKKSAVKSKEK